MKESGRGALGRGNLVCRPALPVKSAWTRFWARSFCRFGSFCVFCLDKSLKASNKSAKRRNGYKNTSIASAGREILESGLWEGRENVLKKSLQRTGARRSAKAHRPISVESVVAVLWSWRGCGSRVRVRVRCGRIWSCSVFRVAIYWVSDSSGHFFMCW